MADYIYLLQTRLNAAQRTTLELVRAAAKARAMTIFLVGGAVRDLSTGTAIRDIDLAVQGDARKLKKDLQAAGGVLTGENDATQTLYFSFPGGVRMEVGATLTAAFPKPGKPVYTPAAILDDLRRRDYTANAMAISLNEGSYGLLMDPLNGIADLENRELRLVSNYGFIEDPARMIRGARLMARLGWQFEEKTQQRYENGKTEGYISALSPVSRGYELEEILHEEDPLRILRKLEVEGWMKTLFPAWTSKHVHEAELGRMQDMLGQLEHMGIHPDPSAAFFPLMTAKLGPKDVSALKKSFARPGFVTQVEALDGETKAFATAFTAKAVNAPSDTWKLLFASPPEQVLWLAHTSRSGPVQAKFKAFLEVWSQAGVKIPYQMMQEMRIVPELKGYKELLDEIFFAIMDGKMETPEATKAYLEPFSPPAPPPPVNMRRKVAKREAKPAKSRSKKVAAVVVPDAEAAAVDMTVAVETPVKAVAPAKAAVKAAPAKTVATKVASAKAVSPAKAAPAKAAPVKAAPVKAAVAKKSVPVKQAPVKKVPVKVAVKKAVKAAAKKAVAKKSVPAKKAAVKKAVAKKAVPVKKAAAKKAVAKKAVAKKAVAKKAVAKKAVAKKAVAKKVVAKKSPVKVAAKPAKPLAKRSAVKKTVAKKAVKAVPAKKARKR